MYLVWSEELAIGIEIIDDQHKELFNRVNILLEAMSRQRGQDEILKTLDYLEDYINNHFKYEEEIQKKNNYHECENQKKEHYNCREGIKVLRNKIETEGIKASYIIIVQQKMSDWCLNHVSKADRKFGKYLSEIDC